MGTVGVQEMVVIFIIALVLFGPKKLPELGRTIGKAITEFRRASNDLKSTIEREMQTLERESQSISQVANITAGDIFNRAINYDPDHEVRSLPPAETAWNPLEPQKVDSESHESVDQHASADVHSSEDHHTSASISTSLSTAADPSTVGASAISGAESTETAAEAVPSPEPVPALEGTVPRSERSAQPQHS